MEKRRAERKKKAVAVFICGGVLSLFGFERLAGIAI
jgi:hypothetical protein